MICSGGCTSNIQPCSPGLLFFLLQSNEEKQFLQKNLCISHVCCCCSSWAKPEMGPKFSLLLSKVFGSKIQFFTLPSLGQFLLTSFSCNTSYQLCAVPNRSHYVIVTAQLPAVESLIAGNTQHYSDNVQCPFLKRLLYLIRTLLMMTHGCM